MFRIIKNHAMVFSLLAATIIVSAHISLSVIMTSRSMEHATAVIDASTALTLVAIALLMFPINADLNRARARGRR